MFEKQVADLLTSYGSQYIQDLDASSLHIGVFSGDVVLRDLKLRPDALDPLNLPVDIQRGYIGKLVMKVPWRSLKSSPTVLEIHDLYMLVKPKNWRGGYDEEALQKAEEQAKQAALNAFEARRKAREEADKLAATETTKKTGGFVASLTESIVNNLRIVINSIHVRLEVTDLLPRPFVLGLAWGGMTIASTDAEGAETFVKAGTDVSHKRLHLRDFSVYLDAAAPPAREAEFEAEPSWVQPEPPAGIGREWVDAMRAGIGDPAHRYILEPFSLTVTLQMLALNLVDPTRPRFHASIGLDLLSLQLRNAQYVRLLELAEFFTNFQKLTKYARFRPQNVRVKDAPRLFWRFAINAVRSRAQEKKRLESTVFWQVRRLLRDEYVVLHKRLQDVPWLEPLTEAERRRHDMIERHALTADLIAWRTLVHAELAVEAKRHRDLIASRNQAKAAKPQGGFFGWFYGGGGEEGHEDLTSQEGASIRLSAEDREELYSSVGYNPGNERDEADLGKNYVKVVAVFQLKETRFVLHDHRDRAITCLTSRAMEAKLRLKSEGMVVGLSLHDLCVSDELNKGVTQFPQVLRTNTGQRPADHGEPRDLLMLQYEAQPEDANVDSKLRLTMETTDLILNPLWMQALLAFWAVPAHINLSSLEAAVASSLQSIQSKSVESLKMAAASRATMDMQLSIGAPNLVVPLDCHAPRTLALCADLGRLSLATDLDPDRDRRIAKGEAVEEDDFYDRLRLGLADIQLSFAYFDAGRWQSDRHFHAVEPFGMSLTLWRCLTPDSEELARMKVTGELQNVTARFTPKSYEWAMRVLDVLQRWTADLYGAGDRDRLAEAQVETLAPAMIPGDPGEGNYVPPQDELQWAQQRAELWPDKVTFHAHSDGAPDAVTHVRLSHLVRLDWPIAARTDDLNEALVGDEHVGCLLLPQGGSKDQPDRLLRLVVRIADDTQRAHFLRHLRDLLLTRVNHEAQRVAAAQAVAAGQPVLAPAAGEELHAPRPVSLTQVNTLVDLQLGEVKLSLGNHVDDHFEPAYSMALSGFHFGMQSRNFDSMMSATLNAFTVRDLSQEAGGRYPNILSVYREAADQAKDGMVFRMLSLTEQSPRYDKAQNIATDINIDMQGLTLDLEREAAPRTIAYLFKYQMARQALQGALQGQVVFSANEGAVAPAQAGTTTPTGGQTALVANMRALLLRFINRNVLLFQVAAKEQALAMRSSAAELTLEGSMGDLIVDDHPEETAPWTRMMGCHAGTKCVQFAYRVNNQPEATPEAAQYTSSITASLNELRVVYLARFVKQCTQYFDAGHFMRDTTAEQQALAAQAQAYASAAAAEYAQYLAQRAAAVSQQLMQFSFRLQHPTIVVPQRHDSENYALLNLGLITIANHLQPFDAAGEKAERGMVEAISLDIHEMTVGIRDHRLKNNADLLKDMSLLLSITRPIHDPRREHPTTAVTSAIEEMRVVLAKGQYDALLTILNANLLDDFRDAGLAAADRPATPRANAKPDAGDAGTDTPKRRSRAISGGAARKPELPTGATPPPKEEKAEAEDRVATTAMFTFRRLTVELWDDQAGEPEGIAVFGMEGLKVQYRARPSGAADLRVALRLLLARDGRAHTKAVCTDLLRYEAFLEDEWLLEYHTRQSTTDISLQLGDPTVTLLPDVVRPVLAFFTVPVQQQRAEQKAAEAASLPQKAQERPPGDWVVGEDTTLVEDLLVDPARRLVFRGAPGTRVAVDGGGHRIALSGQCHRNVPRGSSSPAKNPPASSSSTAVTPTGTPAGKPAPSSAGTVAWQTPDKSRPGIIVEDGVTVYLRNCSVSIKAGELREWVVCGTRGAFEVDPESVEVLVTGTAQRAAPKAAILVPRKGAAASLMRLSLRFTGPRGGPTLMLPEDPADPNAILVVAALRLQATAEQGGEEGRQEVNAGISDLMVYCSRVGAEGHTYHGKSVIGPVSLTLSAFTRLGSYEDRTTVARHASLTATRNHVRVSYRDILAFLAIARAAGNVMPQPPQPEGPRPTPANEHEDEAGVVTTTAPPDPGPAANLRLNATMRGLDLLLVDDSRGFDVDLLRFSLDQARLVAGLDSTGTATTVKGTGHVTAAMWYYHLQHCAWEPVLEPVGFSLQLDRTVKDSSTPTQVYYNTDLAIVTDKGRGAAVGQEGCLNFSVSNHMLETLLSTSDLWRKGLFGGQKDVAPASSQIRNLLPFSVRNRTGLTVTVAYFDRAKTEVRRALPSAEQHDFATAEGHEEVGVDFGDGLVRHLGLREVGRAVVSVGLPALYEANVSAVVTLVEGQKVLTLSSRYSVMNLCTCPMDVQIQTPGSEPYFTRVCTGDPQSTAVHLPCTVFAAGTTILFRPSPAERQRAADYGWCAAQSIYHGHTLKGAPVLLQCRAPDPGPTFFIAWEVQSFGRSLTDPVTFRLQAPLSFQNLLPEDVAVYFSTAAEMPDPSAAKVKVHEERAFHTLDFLADIWMSIQLPRLVPTLTGARPVLVYATDRRMSEDREDRLVCVDKQSHRSLTFHVVNTVLHPKQAARELRVYCSYWVINNTSWPFGRLDLVQGGRSLAGFSRDSHGAHPAMLSQDDVGHGVALSIDGAPPSGPLPVDTVGQRGAIKVQSADRDRTYNVGVAVDLAPGDFNRTKIIRLAPLFELHNETDEVLVLQQYDFQGTDLCQLNPDQHIHFDVWRRLPGQDGEADPLLQLKPLEGLYSTRWSSPFRITASGFSDVVLWDPVKPRLRQKVVRCTVSQKDATTFIILSHPTHPPLSVVCNTFHSLEVRQRGTPLWLPVEPFACVPFYWPSAELEKRIEVRLEGNEALRREVNVLTLDKGRDSGIILPLPDGTHLKLKSLLGSETITLVISDEAYPLWYVEAGDYVYATEGTWAQTEDDNTMKMNLNASLGLSLIAQSDNTPRELAYLYFGGLDVTCLVDSDAFTTFFKVHRVQLDNQMRHAIYPMVMSIEPVQVPMQDHEVVQGVLDRMSDAARQLLEELQPDGVRVSDLEAVRVLDDGRAARARERLAGGEPAAAVWNDLLDTLRRQRKEAGDLPALARTKRLDAVTVTLSCQSYVTNIKSFDLLYTLVQTMVLQVEDQWLLQVADWGQRLMPTQTRDVHEDLQYRTAYTKEEFSDASGKLYFGLMALSPLRINLSFTSEISYAGSLNPLLIFLNTAGNAVKNIEDAPLRFNTLVMHHTFGTANSLMWDILHFYMRQGIMEFYKLLGSMQFLGNPVALLSNVSDGVMDFFYEPIYGAFESPLGLGRGLAKGTTSLLKHGVYGFANAASGVTSSLSKGVASLTFDEEYGKQRRRKMQERPQSLGEGMAIGAQALGKGVVGGLTGIVWKPLEGAQADGVTGFVKGVATGVAGVFLKPMAGMLDLLEGTTRGLKSVAGGERRLGRVRLPRAQCGPVLEPYDPTLARANHYLHTLDQKRYIHEDLKAVVLSGHVLTIFSTDRVIRLLDKPNAEQPQPTIVVPYGEVDSIWQEGPTLRLVFKKSVAVADPELTFVRCRSTFQAASVLDVVREQCPAISVQQWDFTGGKESGVAVTWELERYSLGVGWDCQRLPGDPPEWTDDEGTEYCPRESFRLPAGGRWTGDWAVESSTRADTEGWLYGHDWKDDFRPADEDCVVRKRRWVRPFAVDMELARQSKPRDVSHTKGNYSIVWQHQTWHPIFGWTSIGLPEGFYAWSDSTGKVNLKAPGDEALPSGCAWAPSSTWVVPDMHIQHKSFSDDSLPVRDCDVYGWEYDFTGTGAFGRHKGKKQKGALRRRRWVRQFEEAQRAVVSAADGDRKLRA
eukprot:EG_transcript_19